MQAAGRGGGGEAPYYLVEEAVEEEEEEQTEENAGIMYMGDEELKRCLSVPSAGASSPKRPSQYCYYLAESEAPPHSPTESEESEASDFCYVEVLEEPEPPKTQQQEQEQEHQSNSASTPQKIPRLDNLEKTEAETLKAALLHFLSSGGKGEGSSTAGSSSSAHFLLQHLEASLDVMGTKWKLAQRTTALADNRRFQKLMALSDNVLKYEALAQFARDFVHLAETFGKIIILERHLPVAEKIIKPQSLGGQAGGEKFIYRGILFKYATDTMLPITRPMWMYGGADGANDEAAMKAAGNELRGISRFMSASQDVDLHFPLLALIDYLGYRLMAITMLPINGETLRLGSDDGGRTVHNNDAALYNKVKKVAKRLNLKPHIVNYATLYGPGDLEGHLGQDNLHYVLDFGRCYPPEAPKQGDKDTRAIFYKHFRPEFVHAYSKPLSPDAFSGWQACDSARSIHNRELREATTFLHQTVIPAFARKLDDRVDVRDEFYVSEMHRHGINIRHAGVLRSCCTNSYPRKILLSEMVARVLKVMVRSCFRQQIETEAKQRDLGKASSGTSHVLSRSILVELLNFVLDTKFSVEWWSCLSSSFDATQLVETTDAQSSTSSVLAKYPSLGPYLHGQPSLKHRLLAKFGKEALSPGEQHERCVIHEHIFFKWLFVRLISSLSIRIHPGTWQEFIESDDRYNFVWVDSDVEGLDARVKHTSVISFYQGKSLMLKALSSDTGARERLRILRQAQDKMFETWNSNSDDFNSVFHFAVCNHELAQALLSRHARNVFPSSFASSSASSATHKNEITTTNKNAAAASALRSSAWNNKSASAGLAPKDVLHLNRGVGKHGDHVKIKDADREEIALYLSFAANALQKAFTMKQHRTHSFFRVEDAEQQKRKVKQHEKEKEKETEEDKEHSSDSSKTKQTKKTTKPKKGQSKHVLDEVDKEIIVRFPRVSCQLASLRPHRNEGFGKAALFYEDIFNSANSSPKQYIMIVLKESLMMQGVEMAYLLRMAAISPFMAGLLRSIILESTSPTCFLNDNKNRKQKKNKIKKDEQQEDAAVWTKLDLNGAYDILTEAALSQVPSLFIHPEGARHSTGISIQRIDLSTCNLLSDHSVLSLLQALGNGGLVRSLTELHLAGCHKLTDKLFLDMEKEGLMGLLKGVKKLRLDGCDNLSKQGLTALLSACGKHSLEALSICGCSGICACGNLEGERQLVALLKKHTKKLRGLHADGAGTGNEKEDAAFVELVAKELPSLSVVLT
ncbi:lysine (K)-specific demethylase 2Aa isoform X4 [Balamuthia mandrillaris]